MPSGAHPAASGLSDGLALGLSRLLQAALGFVAQKALFRSLSEEDLGRWFLFQVVANVAIATLSWPSNSVVRLGAEEWSAGRRLGRTFALHGGLLLASTAILAGLAAVFHEAIDAYVRLEGATVFVVAYAFLAAAGLVVGAHLKPAQQVARFALLPLVTRVFWAGSLSVLAFGLARDLGTREVQTRDIVLACFLTAVPQLFVALGLVARTVVPLARWTPGDDGRALRFGIPVLARQLGMQALAYVNFVIIGPKLDVIHAGRFQVAATLPEQAALFATALEDLMGPILARAAHKGHESTLRVYYRTLAPQVVLGWSALAGAALVLARPILFALSAKAVDVTAPALEVLLLATAVRVIVSVETPVLDAHLISTPSLAFYGLGFATNVALTLALIPRYGVEGAAWGSLAGWLVNSLARSLFCRARFGAQALRLYVRLWPAVAALAWARLAPTEWTAGLGRDCLAALVLLLATLVLGKLFGVFAPETLEAIEGVRMPGSLRRALEVFYGKRPGGPAPS